MQPLIQLFQLEEYYWQLRYWKFIIMTYVDIINFSVGTMLFCFFEAVLIIDLYSLMRNPFQSKRRNAILYQLLALFVCLMGTMYGVMCSKKLSEARYRPDINIERIVLTSSTYMVVYFYLIRVICLITSQSKAMNADFKRSVKCHYILMYLVLLPTFLIFAYELLEMFFDLPYKVTYYSPVKFIISTCNISYLVVRLCEPHMYTNLFGCCFKETKEERGMRSRLREDNLSVFLNTTSNIDYVYMILAGVKIMNDSVGHVPQLS